MSTLSPRMNETQVPHATLGGRGAIFGGSPAGGPVNAGPGNSSDPPRFRPQVMRSLRMHPILALAVGAFVCLAIVGLAASRPRLYQAESFIYVEPIASQDVTDKNAPGFDSTRYDSYVQQQMQTVTRPDILTAALKNLPPGIWHIPGESEQSAAQRLHSVLNVQKVPGYQISISLQTGNPEASALIVNAVTDAYLRGGRRDELTEADQRVVLLSEERQRIKNELDADRKEQTALGTNLGVASVAETGNPFDAETASLRTELSVARQAHDVASAQLSSVSGQGTDQRSGLAAAADESLNTDPGLSAMKASVNARRATLQSDMAGLTPNNPRYRQDQDEIADLDRSVDSMTAQLRDRAQRRIQDRLRTELERTAGIESKLNSQLAQETQKATGAGPKLQRAQELTTDIQRLTVRFGDVDDALRGLQLQTDGPGLAHLAMAAQVPAVAQPNKRNLFLMVALPFSLVWGVAAAVVARARDKRVFLGTDLEEAVGFAPMAVLPASADVPERVTDEYVLRLAAAVEGAYRTASARTFVITPVSPFTSISSLVEALSDKLEDLRMRVLVVPGSALLVTSAETAEHQAYVESGSTNGLTNAPGNRFFRAALAGEGIASAKLERMKSDNDLILIEAAPLLHSAETEYAARCADATILVAESGLTLSTELKDATELLSRLQVSGVGAVLDGLQLRYADKTFKTAVATVEQRNIDAVFERSVPVQREAPVTVAAVAPVKQPPVVTPLVQKVEEVQKVEAKIEAVPEVIAPSVPLPEPVQAPAAIQTPVVEPPVVLQPRVEPVLQPVAQPVVPPAVQPIAQPVAQPIVPPIAQPIARPIVPLAAPPAFQPPVPLPVQPFIPAVAQVAAQRTLSPKSWAQHDASGVYSADRLLGFSAAAAAAAVPAAVSAPAPAEAPVVVSPPVLPQPVIAASIPVPVVATTDSGVQAFPVQRPAMPLAVVSAPEVQAQEEDSQAVGRFIGEKDRIGTVPSYTRSKIRRAFKEQEVNSKTTWFSKLFRGDPPASFRIVPEEDEDEMEPQVSVQQFRENVRAQEESGPTDSELEHLLVRINRSGERKPAPEAAVAAVPTSTPVAVAVTAPRPIVPERAYAVEEPAQPPVWEPAPVSPPQPVVTARAPRPLSFQQLVGVPPAPVAPEPVKVAEAPIAVEPERIPEEPKAIPPQPEPAQVFSAAPEEENFWPTKAPLPPAQEFVRPPAQPDWSFSEQPEQPEQRWQAPPVHEPAPVHVEAFTSEFAVPPVPSAPVAEVISDPAPEPIPEVAALPAEPLPPFIPQPGPSSRFEAYLSPSARALYPDPLSDPAPSVRNYRLEQTVPAAAESPVFVERRTPEPVIEPVAGQSQPSESLVHPRRRSSDHPGESGILTRRWKLLSQFEPDLSDPMPAARQPHHKLPEPLPIVAPHAEER